VVDSIKDIMDCSERFLAVFKLFEFYNFPEGARENQLRIMDFVVRYMNCKE